MKRRIKAFVAKRLMNPVVLRVGHLIPLVVIVETTGRRTGLPRRTPVGGKRFGNEVIVISEDGFDADYVKNIEADPRVRVKVKRAWFDGTASLHPEENPKEVARSITWIEWPLLRFFGTGPLVIRISLDADQTPSNANEARRG